MPRGLELSCRRARHILHVVPNRVCAGPTRTATLAIACARCGWPSPPTTFARTVCVTTRLDYTNVRRSFGTSTAAVPVVSWSDLGQKAEDRRKKQIETQEGPGTAALTIDAGAGVCTDAASSADGLPSRRGSAPPSRGAILIESFACNPVLPHGERASSLSALVEPSQHYKHPHESRQSRVRHRKSVTRQARLEIIRQARRQPLPDWRAILRRLAANSSPTFEPRSLLTPLLASLQSAESESENFAKPGSSDTRKPDAASDQAVNFTERRDDPVYRPYTLYHGAHKIRRPTEWTRDSFEHYVAALTNGRPPRHLAAKLYRGVAIPRRGSNSSASTNIISNHDNTVIELLHSAFNEEAARPALSTSAFKMALSFMCRRGETHRPDARALFVRMEMFGLPMDTETFNIMLASQVKTQDLRNFGATLVLMHGRGHAPDLTTWLLFLRLFESEEVKRHILRAMHARGLLDSAAAMQSVAQVMTEYDAERAVRQAASIETPEKTGKEAIEQTEVVERSGQHGDGDGSGYAPDFLDAFLARQTARYGDGWLTRKAANSILGVFARHGRFPDCHRLIRIMQTRQHGAQTPDVTTFNTVLTHCKLQTSLPRAIATIAQMDGAAADGSGAGGGLDESERDALPHPPAVAPDSISYQMLFDLAFLRRLPYTLGVVWHYASLARQTGWRMRRRVSRLLAGRIPGRAKCLLPVLRAGCVGDGPSSSSDAAEAHLGNVVSERLAARYRGWEPIVPLSVALQEAVARDNALLRARYSADAQGGSSNASNAVTGTSSPLQLEPMRVLLRRKRRTDNDANNAAGESGRDTKDGEAKLHEEDHTYMEIHVRQTIPITRVLSRKGAA